MLQRRLRGLLAVVTGGFIVGATAGVALGLILLLSPGPKEITVHPQFPGAIVLLPALLLGVPGGDGAGVASALAVRLFGWSWATVAFGSVVGAAIGAACLTLAKRNARRAVLEGVDLP
jgi:hypothetical protein